MNDAPEPTEPTKVEPLTDADAEAVLLVLGDQFSEKTRQVLANAGWTADRHVDVTQVKADLEHWGYHWNKAAEAFLRRFWGIHTPYTESTFISRETNWWYESDEVILYLEQEVGKELCPIGYFHRESTGLLIAEDGTTYWAAECDSGFFADDYGAALNQIFEAGSEMRPSQQVNGWAQYSTRGGTAGSRPSIALLPRQALFWEMREGSGKGEFAHSLTGVYTIVENRKNWFSREYVIAYGSDSKRVRYVSPPYKKQVDAKTACERHHTTGKW